MMGAFDSVALLFCLTATLAVLTGLTVLTARRFMADLSETLTGLGVATIAAWGWISMQASGAHDIGMELWPLGIGVVLFLISVARESNPVTPHDDMLIVGVTLLPLGAQLLV